MNTNGGVLLWLLIALNFGDAYLLFFSCTDKPIGFTAYLTHPLTNQNKQTVVYDHVTANVGSGFDTKTGVFTAPQEGDYMFTWNAMTKGRGSYCHLYLYRNGISTIFSAFADMNGRTTGSDRGSNSAILALMAGDRVWIQTGTCHYLYSQRYTSFSGFKICQWDRVVEMNATKNMIKSR